jgi:hypothetical protein
MGSSGRENSGASTPPIGVTNAAAPSGDTTGATDTAALQAQLNTIVAAGGGILQLRAGDYYVTGLTADIHATPAGLIIRGVAGTGTTKVHNASIGVGAKTKACFYINGGGVGGAPYPGPVGENWIEISDIELIGSAAGGPGIYLDVCYQGILKNIRARGFTSGSGWGVGIFLALAIEVEVINPVVTGCTYGLVAETNIANIRGGWFQGNATNEAWVLSSSQVNFWGTVFQGSGAVGTGLRVESAAATKIDGCWFENNAIGLDLASGATATVVSGGTFTANTTDVKIRSGATGTTISEPYFLDATPSGITADAGSTHTVLEHANANLTAARITDNSSGQLIYRDNAGVADTAVVAAAAADPLGQGLVESSDPLLYSGVSALNSTTTVYHRTKGGGTIGKIGVYVGTSSGNISLATYTGAVGRNPPDTRTQTTGAVACPASGYAEVALGGNVTVRTDTGWLAISADNATATFGRVGGTPGGDNAFGTGRAYLQNGHPAPSTPSSLIASWRIKFILVGQT